MARLSKEELADKSRYQFKAEEVEIPELDGSVEIKTLSVEERDALPDLIDADGKPSASVGNLAKVFAAVVSEPEVTAAEAEAFLGDLPATALDRVIKKFGELLETDSEEEAAEKRSDFRSPNDE